MKAPATFLTLTLFLLVGCPPGPTHYWYHPDKTLEQAKEDYLECETRAEDGASEAVADEELVQSRSRSRSSDDEWKFYDDHVKSRSSLGAMYEKNVFEGCMQGKGYIMVQDYRLPSDLRTKDYSKGGVAGR
jgi:hypothetical protein